MRFIVPCSSYVKNAPFEVLTSKFYGSSDLLYIQQHVAVLPLHERVCPSNVHKFITIEKFSILRANRRNIIYLKKKKTSTPIRLLRITERTYNLVDIPQLYRAAE